MMKINLTQMKKLLGMLLLALLSFNLAAQTTVVTDDESYVGNNSAMLDVYSKTKGLLAPRMTTAERNAITTPANGLLVYDETENQYYVYSNSSWNTLDAPSIWQMNGDSIYVTGSGKKYGVGTASPLAKLTVQGDASTPADEALFEVKNSAGDVIFAVYENEVKVNFKEGVKGNKGGFAVGGLSGGKADPTEYLRVTPDSVRVYIKEGAKGVKGGFAVGGLSGGKAGNERYLTVERDSTRININEAVKGVKGGFAVGGLSGGKGGNNFVDLTPENYFIGQGAGASITTGLYNSFMGYEAGFLNKDGMQNIFIGYQAGYKNKFGNWNTFLGFEAGLSNSGSDNTFIGYKAGRNHQYKGGNVHLGSKAGENATNGEQNIFIGESSGSYTTNGSQNVFMGFKSGFNNSGYTSLSLPEDSARGSFNVYIGHETGHESRQANRNVFIGYKAGRLTYNNGSSLNNGSQNVFVGNEAGHNNTTGYSNVFIGNKAGYHATRWESVFIGNEAGYNTTTPVRNVFIGNEAGHENVVGQYNTYIGDRAGRNGTGYYNTIIGGLAARENDFGNSNVIIGYVAGSDIVSSRNILIGQGAGYNNTAADGNNVFIGYQAGSLLSSESYRLVIGMPDSRHLIYGEFDTDRVAINGSNTGGKTFYVNGTAGGSSGWGTKADVNSKSSIESIEGALDKVKKLQGVSFIWEDNKELGRQLGLNGQDVKQVLPEVVGNEDSGFAIEYGSLTPVLIEAIKEQQKQIDELRKANKELNEKVSKLLNN
jgi:hypothetical protein